MSRWRRRVDTNIIREFMRVYERLREIGGELGWGLVVGVGGGWLGCFWGVGGGSAGGEAAVWAVDGACGACLWEVVDCWMVGAG